MRVAALGVAAIPLIHGLAASGVGRWLIDEAIPGEPLAASLLEHHGPALGLEIAALDEASLGAAAPDLLIGAGGAPDLRRALGLARRHGIAALLVAPPSGSPARPAAARAILPDDDPVQTEAFLQALEARPANDQAEWAGAAGLTLGRGIPAPAAWHPDALLAAGLARAILLRAGPFARADLGQRWAAGRRELYFADPADPCVVALAPPEDPPASFTTPPTDRGTVLIAGIGSLGSVAAPRLLPWFPRFILADPDSVEATNPVRQAYPAGAIGQPKTAALGASLRAMGAAAIRPIAAALADEAAVAAIIEGGVAAALVCTGTAADFAIARALRAADIPHVVGRCYPRARYWEAILVEGARGPGLGDLRGHLALGPAPRPTPEQIAAYSDAGALEAEPATLLESGWAAGWMARLLVQLSSPPGLREGWFLDLLAAGRTCLIGGVSVEETADGPAYGIALPGQVRAYGLGQIRRDG